MPNISIFTSPLGSQLTSTIDTSTDPPEPDDKNDFSVYVTADGNMTLEESDITLDDADFSIQSFEGSGATFHVRIRPPVTAAVLTLTIAENATPEGNDAVSETIRVSTTFPDADAEAPTFLFDHSGGTGVGGISVSDTEIFVYSGGSSSFRLRRFEHDGTEISNETYSGAGYGDIDYINGDLLVAGGTGTQPGGFQARRIILDDPTNTRPLPALLGHWGAISHSRLGILFFDGTNLSIQPYDGSQASSIEGIGNPGSITHQADFVYFFSSGLGLRCAEIVSDSEIVVRGYGNVSTSVMGSGFSDTAIYRDTMYFVSNNGVYTIDLRKYRSLTQNTKTTIYTVFANNGETIDATRYAPDASEIIWDTGFDLPDYLSINANNQIVIADDAVSETTPVLIKLRGLNYIDAIDISFYLIIEVATAPVWRDVDALTMPANSAFDMHLIVDADSITLQSSPTGSSISNGVFTIGTTGGDVTFRATKDGLTADKTLTIDVIQSPNEDNFSDVFRFRVEIAGIDVSDDLLRLPTVQKSLDNLELDVSRVDEVSFTLVDNKGFYNPEISGSFWSTNSLNPGGYQEEVKVYLESLVNGAFLSSLLFVGVIDGQAENITDIEAEITAIDVSLRLQNTITTDFGTLEKWDRLRAQSDEADFEGVYIPEGSLSPMQPETGQAWHDRTPLSISQLQLPSEGPRHINTAYMSDTDFRTSGGFFEDAPVLNFKTQHRAEDIRFLFSQLGINKQVYNTDVQLPAFTLPDAFVSSRGSVGLQTEDTRITRLPSDWVYDTTNNRLLVLMHNPESHIADQLVQYDIARDNYRTLYTFDQDVKAHRIERRSATLYYVLTSEGITQDRSAANVPRTSDKTGYGYDSRAEGSVIRIHRYNATSNTLTEFVPEDDDRPPQLGVHYWIGEENKLYADSFEGIISAYRGAFEWYSNHLYYRYCDGSEFGVARADTSGTTESLIENVSGYPTPAFFCLAGGTTNDWVVIFPEVGSGETPSDNDVIRVTLPTTLQAPGGVAIDGDTLYIADDGGDEIFVFSIASLEGGETAVESRQFDMPSGLTAPVSLAIHGNDLYVADTTGDEMFVVPADTEDGETATITRRFNLPAGVDDPRGMAIDPTGTDLYIVDDSGDDIHIIPANTANNATATIAREFSLPPSISNAQGMTLRGNDLCIVDITDDDLYIIPADTPDGTNLQNSDIVLQFNLPGISFPNGVAIGGWEFPIQPLSYQNHLNFAFDVDTSNGDQYFVQAAGSETNSVLIIKKRTSGGTETTVLTDAKALSELTDLDENGGAYLGCYECLYHSDTLYMLCPIQRVDEGERDRAAAAGMILYSCNVNDVTPELTVIETWAFATHSACNLIVHDGAVHFVEQSPAATYFKPINPNL